MSEIKILKIVHKDKVYVGQNGKEYATVNYYVSFNLNGKEKLIPVRPAFRKGYDFLDLICETRVNAVIKPSKDED